MTSMFDPAHPGRALMSEIEGRSLSITEVAAHLGIERTQLALIINEKAGISAELSAKIGVLFNTSPDFWSRMQINYDYFEEGNRRKTL